MSLSRRKFLTTWAAGSAVLAAPGTFGAPFQISVHRDGGDSADAGPQAQRAPFAIPSTMPMGSGAPLGGIGTGFVEIRADGCFHEWQIFNSGPWSQNARTTTAPPAPGPQYLRFVLRTKKASDQVAQVRRLYLRSDENDLYTLPFVQDVESIDYYAWFPMTGLRYNDPTIPVHASAQVFSPFIPGNARDSGTPGFHIVYSLENASDEAVEVSLAGFLENPLASALTERHLSNSVAEGDGETSLLLQTAAESDFPSGIGSMCFSVGGGEQSFICGTFQEYMLPGNCRWETPRVNYMLLNELTEFAASGRLPSTKGGSDPSIGLPTMAQIDGLSASDVRNKIKELSSDALLARVFSDAQLAHTDSEENSDRNLLKEVSRNLLGEKNSAKLTWGTGALASSVHLAPGEKAEIRFTLSWFFPHHLTTDGREMGHMYSHWYGDAGDVNRFLCAHYDEHRATTEGFARTVADTSLGDAMSFAWSSQLSTLIFNSWWMKDGSYAIWEGLGCCGLSTTDVDYQGSFPIVALFPELKLSQMKRIIAHQNERGQVPHNFTGNFDQVDSTGFARVDMNPQFVMMVCRDYLWTGNKEYLAFMWPHVVKAMAFTESLDTNGDGLPDRDAGLQTYDQWRMRGTPSYVASLWIGALRAAIRIAKDVDKPDDATRWSDELAKASASFDKMLFNGEYYSLWVDGKTRDELCMTDQISGEWFSHLIGLQTTTSEANLKQSVDSIFQHNFNPEFGLHNATAPKGGAGLLTLNNLQAGGVWSGIEFAFASLLMDHGRYADGVKIVEATHRRYLRAGQPWNHVECGEHYSRAMSSWATMLAATGFKPDMANAALAVMPSAPGDFRAPWVTAWGFGTISRSGRSLSIHCESGRLELKSLKLRMAAQSARVGERPLAPTVTSIEDGAMVEFSTPLSLAANQTLTIS
ncbi:MAG: GH116 family glycosyl hydrolase [Candidatus Acidiferrales bacterium]